MTDIQILTIAISIVIPVGVMLYSNSRVSDVSKRIDDTKADLNRRIDELKSHIDNGFDHMALLLKLHEAEHHKK